ncbi:MAG: NAD(P)-dependent oxidoreductase, partial [Pseudomonadota bacterium]
MKIAVTGGSGFIGQRLVKRLEKAGHQIVNIDSEDPDNPIDICYEQALEKSLEGCDAIYHLAAAHRDDISPKSIYYDVNGQGTKNIIQAAKAHNIQRIIFASTVAVYGLNAGEASEETKPEPFNDYGKSKLEAEQYLKAWQSESDDHILSIIRPVVVFGEGNRGNVYTLMKQIAGNKFIMIGKGQNKKSMAYVEN